MSTFALAPDANTNGTYLLTEVEVPPRRLVDRFGPPPEGDVYKVSGCYIFADEVGNVFTVHDWKCTTLYFDGVESGNGRSLPTPAEFWARTAPEELSVGGREGKGDVEEFKRWLLQEVGG